MFQSCTAPQSAALPARFPLEFPVHGLAVGAGLARWIEAVGELHFAVMPLTLVYDLAFDFTHAGVGVNLIKQTF